MEHVQSHVISKKDVKFYLSIFVVLSFLTLFQVLIYGHFSSLTNAILQSSIALFKVCLVAYYFMHLKDESAWMRFFAAIPIFAIIYTVYISIETIIR